MKQKKCTQKITTLLYTTAIRFLGIKFHMKRIYSLTLILFLYAGASFALPDYPSISCSKLVSDFGANEMRALRDHKNKTYIISAKVESVGADFMDNPQINLSDGEEWSFNSCMAEPARGEDFYYDLYEGQLVKMQCTVTGEMMGSPMLERCVLVN